MVRANDIAKHSAAKLKLVVACLALFLSCHSQRFSNLYYDDKPSMLFGSVDPNDGRYYVTGVMSSTSPPHVPKAIFGRIEDSGAFDTIIVIGDTNAYWHENFRGVYRTADDNHIFLGSTVDSLSKAFLIKIDTSGNILLRRDYPYGSSEFVKGQDVVEIPGQGYLLVLLAYSSNTASDVIVIRADTLGNILNQNAYSLAVKDIPSVIRRMSNGNYMIGAANVKPTAGSPFWCKTWLIEVDSMGNKVNEWIDADQTHMWPNSMQQTADSGWIIVRQHLAYDHQGFQAFNTCIVRLDKHFNKEWEIDTGEAAQQAGMYDVEILPDGGYVCCGTTTIADSEKLYGSIMRVSSTGDVIWQQNYLPVTAQDTWAYLYDIDILPNGDLLACGEKSSSFPLPQQQAWLLRTGSNGCIIENCTVGIGDFESKTEISIYPNPFSDEVTFSLDHAALYDAKITLSNPLGQVLHHASNVTINDNYTLDLNTLPQGLYFISIESKGERIVKQVVKQ